MKKHVKKVIVVFIMVCLFVTLYYMLCLMPHHSKDANRLKEEIPMLEKIDFVNCKYTKVNLDVKYGYAFEIQFSGKLMLSQDYCNQIKKEYIWDRKKENLYIHDKHLDKSFKQFMDKGKYFYSQQLIESITERSENSMTKEYGYCLYFYFDGDYSLYFYYHRAL